jgi:glycosyltransferase involved in cell wall biosynthesis
MPETTVSVICPTFGRPERHKSLYDVFDSQDYPHKDLWLMDDSPEPSPFFAELGARDRRVHYVHSSGRLTVGAKRNWLVNLSRGQVIAHFDDDDWYDPRYLASMVGALDEQKVDLVKLSVWRALCETDGSFWQWDTQNPSGHSFVVTPSSAPQEQKIDDETMAKMPADLREKLLWGYGFSYVYRRALAMRCPFPSLDFGEDIDFILRAQSQGRVAHLSDRATLVVHTIHKQNLSRIFPQERLDTNTLPRALQHDNALKTAATM